MYIGMHRWTFRETSGVNVYIRLPSHQANPKSNELPTSFLITMNTKSMNQTAKTDPRKKYDLLAWFVLRNAAIFRR